MRRLLCAMALLALAACSKDKEVDPPAELTEFTSTLRVQQAWSASIGGDDKPLRLGLGLAVVEGKVFAAGHEGEVAAFDLGSGKALWRTRTKARLSGGTGAGTDLVAVGTADGEVIALNAANGAVLWRVKVNGEVLSAPAIAPEAVVVRTVDGKLHGLAPSDGRQLWDHEETVPRLTLRGTSRPVIANDVALCGFDNGKVVAVNVRDGALVWETAVAPPHGKTELERLVDIDSAARVSGNDVYTVGFQGRVAMLAFDTGQVWWSHDASSYRGLGLDDEAMYISTSEGEVVALRRRSGAEIWRQNALLHRGLSAPAVQESTIAVADFQGYVHWFDKATGTLAARASSGKVRVTNSPVAVGNMVLVVNDEGRITAFRTTPIDAATGTKNRRKAPAAKTPEAGTATGEPSTGSEQGSSPSAPDVSAPPDAGASPSSPDVSPQPDASASPHSPDGDSQPNASASPGSSDVGEQPNAGASPRSPEPNAGTSQSSPDASSQPDAGATPSAPNASPSPDAGVTTNPPATSPPSSPDSSSQPNTPDSNAPPDASTQPDATVPPSMNLPSNSSTIPRSLDDIAAPDEGEGSKAESSTPPPQ
jgi:outer membrane protein assembly factor BamB